MSYTIVGEMTAGGSGGGRFYNRLSDPDGKVIIFENYEDAVKRCDGINSKLANRNLRYRVERRLDGRPFA